MEASSVVGCDCSTAVYQRELALALRRRQGSAEEAQPVPVEDRVDLGVLVAALREDALERLEIAIDAEIDRRLLVAESAIQIAADRDMPGIAGKLTDVIDMVRHGAQRRRTSQRRSNHETRD